MLHIRQQRLGQDIPEGPVYDPTLLNEGSYVPNVSYPVDYNPETPSHTAGPATTTSAPSSSNTATNALLAASLLNQGIRPPIPYMQPTTSYLPYILGGVALLAVVMVVGK